MVEGVYTLLVWSDGHYSEYWLAGGMFDLADDGQLQELAGVVPTRSGRMDRAEVARLADALSGDVTALTAVDDDTSCTAVDGVAHRYAFPTARPAVSFATCLPPPHPVVAAAAAVVQAVRSDVPYDIDGWDPDESPSKLAGLFIQGRGHLVEAAVATIDDDAPAIGIKVTEMLAGPAETMSGNSFVIEFNHRRPTPLEAMALSGVEIGDRVLAVIDDTGKVVSAGLLDERGELVDTGPGGGGLALGNQAAILAVLDGDDSREIVCQLDPGYRQSLPDNPRRVDVVRSVLDEASARGERSQGHGSDPEWMRFVSIAITEPTAGRWIALSVGDTVFGLGEVLELGGGGTLQISYEYFPSGGPMLVWEIDRVAMEAAGCRPDDLPWIPEVLGDYGKLLVTVAEDDVGAAGLRIDLSALTYETGWTGP